MRRPFVLLFIYIQLGAEWVCFELFFRALVYKIALVFAERFAIGVTLYKVLSDLRRNIEQYVSEMSEEREIANDGIFRKSEVDHPDKHHRPHQHE